VLRTLNSLCIRIPHMICGVGQELCDALSSHGFGCGLLIYSPPGVGKTTLLANTATIISSPPYMKRVVLCDERGELYNPDQMRACLIDVISGIPKARAVDIAVRTLSPEIIVCDEIGGNDDTEAILSVQNTGVPLICSAHASSFEMLMKRPSIAALDRVGVFGIYCKISRNTDNRFNFLITEKNNA